MICNKSEHYKLHEWAKEQFQVMEKDQLIVFFDHVVSTIWTRAGKSISSLALSAVFDRVIFRSSEKHPFLNQIVVSKKGINTERLKEIVRNQDKELSIEAFSNTLVELFYILGRITNGVITAALYEAIDKFRFDPNFSLIKSTNGDDK